MLLKCLEVLLIAITENLLAVQAHEAFEPD